MLKLFLLLAFITVVAVSTDVRSAETNTVSSTVVTDKSVPTANAPSVVVNNSDICKVATTYQTPVSYTHLRAHETDS